MRGAFLLKRLFKKHKGTAAGDHHGLPKGSAEASLLLEERSHQRRKLLVVALGGLLIAFALWAHWARLEDVARGQGRVVPSAKVQVIQSLEGGLVEAVLVQPGDVVVKGDVLLRLDDTGFSSDRGELLAKQTSLEIARERLRLQADWPERGEELVYARSVQVQAPRVVQSELGLFAANLSDLKGQEAIFRSRIEQRQAELDASKNQERKLLDLLQLALEEHELKAPMAERQIIPRTDMLKLQREIGELEGQVATLRVTQGRLQAAVREAEQELQGLANRFRQSAQAELSEVQAQLDIIGETLRGAEDKVRRAEIRAPMSGIVNTVDVTTVGGVAGPSQQLMTLVPLEDTLLVEAKVRPQDIAFVQRGQPALVKLSAYDFSIYGGLEGRVDRISADTVYDEVVQQQFYSVLIKTESTNLGNGKEDLRILPGMVASVDIVTGEKSVLSYLLKPINRVREEALTER